MLWFAFRFFRWFSFLLVPFRPVRGLFVSSRSRHRGRPPFFGRTGEPLVNVLQISDPRSLLRYPIAWRGPLSDEQHLCVLCRGALDSRVTSSAAVALPVSTAADSLHHPCGQTSFVNTSLTAGVRHSFHLVWPSGSPLVNRPCLLRSTVLWRSYCGEPYVETLLVKRASRQSTLV